MQCQPQAADKLTVGQKFLLTCQGEWPELNVEKLELRLDEADKYKLKLLQFEKISGSEARLAVTSYRPGTHQLKALQLVDPEHSVVLGDLQFTVESVIQQQEAPPEPFGPIGPLRFGLPWWYYLAALLIICAVASLVWVRMRRRLQKKKLIAEMQLADSALTPISQLSQKLRLLVRELNEENAMSSIVQLDKAFRIYFARKFQIPTLVWSDRLILADFKSHQAKLYNGWGSFVVKTFLELKRAVKAEKNLKTKDVEQLIQLVRTCVDHLERESQ